MRLKLWTSLFVIPLFACGLMLQSGCSETSTDASTETAENEHEHEHGEGEHGLHGYWCVAHGVPEEVCALCNSKVAAEFQAKGDWCEEHGRPDSQCFIHHPELEEKFIAQYEAKFGEKPPARPEE